MIKRFKTVVGREWNNLVEEYTPQSAPTTSEINKVIGLFVVVALVLFCNHFIYFDLWSLFDDKIRLGADKVFYRKVWWAWFVSFCYAVPPYLYARWVLGMTLSDLGVTRAGFAKHIWIYGVGLMVVLPLVFIVSSHDEFMHSYPIYQDAGRSWLHLITWEVSYALQFVTLEFFFRGFLLFGAVRVFGVAAIPAMMVPYMMIHFVKPELECLGSLFAGLALGYIALRTRAIFAGMLIHITVAWSMDFMALLHKGKIDDLFGW